MISIWNQRNVSLRRKIEYLGMIVQQGNISMNPVKLGGIQDWPIPTSVKGVRLFLGFGNFYQQFIWKFADLAQPLNDLLKKDTKFKWTQGQDSFDTLKKKFTEEPVLMMPNQLKPFQIKANASKFAIGAVLTQTDLNGNHYPVAFISKTLSPTEKNYKIYDQKLLSIIRALEEGWHYIHGSGFMFYLITRTLPTSGKLRNSIDNKPGGPFIFWNMISNSHILLDWKWDNLMLSI